MQFLLYKFTSHLFRGSQNVVAKPPVHWLLVTEIKRCNIFCFLDASVLFKQKKRYGLFWPSKSPQTVYGCQSNTWLGRWSKKDSPLSRTVRWNQESSTWSRVQPCHLSPHPSMAPQASLCPFSPCWTASPFATRLQAALGLEAPALKETHPHPKFSQSSRNLASPFPKDLVFRKRFPEVAPSQVLQLFPHALEMALHFPSCDSQAGPGS